MLYKLAKTVQATNPSSSIIDFLAYLSQRWAKKHQVGSEVVANPQFEEIIRCERIDWGDPQWHLKHRIEGDIPEDFELFLKLFSQYQGQEEGLESYLKWYDLSILPLSLLAGEGVNNFLPPLGRKLKKDPFGVRREYSTVTFRDNSGKLWYAATHKPEYGTFLPILRVSCHNGCAGCYRGDQTRHHSPFTLIYADGTEEKMFLPGPVKQIEMLVDVWNSNPEFADVYDMLLSGGEPLDLSNAIIRQLLEVASKATHLKTFRICTGDLCLGLPFRFDEELLSMLVEFRQRTGKQVGINYHITHHQQWTLEAQYFARRCADSGIDMMSQTPIIRGVNIWPEDLDRSVETLRELDRLIWFTTGRRPYKWIVDMQKSVSILTAIEVFRRLVDCHLHESDTTRPTSFALFVDHPTGNINLSFHSLWAITMEVDENRQVVTYQIPHPAGGWIAYEEPVIPRINDDPRYLEELKNPH